MWFPQRTQGSVNSLRHMKVAALAALHTGSLYPSREATWYSLLLEAESTPLP